MIVKWYLMIFMLICLTAAQANDGKRTGHMHGASPDARGGGFGHAPERGGQLIDKANQDNKMRPKKMNSGNEGFGYGFERRQQRNTMQQK